ADVALDVVKFSRVRVRNDQRLLRKIDNLFETARIDVGEIDDDADSLAFLNDFPAQRSQSICRRTACRENSTAAGGIAARVSQSHHAQAELVKHSEQIQILSD